MIVSNYWICFFFITNNAMASNLTTVLTVLDETINIGQTCDIVHVSGMANTNIEEKVQVDYKTVRGTFSVTLEGAKHLTKETFTFSKCLILVTLNYIPRSEVIKLGKRMQLFKPLALLQYKQEFWGSLEEINDVSFVTLHRSEAGEHY